MKNKEFYNDKLIEIVVSGNQLAKVNNKLTTCTSIACSDCDWNDLELICSEMRSIWGEEEYIEPKDNPFELKPCDVYYCVNYEGSVVFDTFFDKSGYHEEVVKFGNACKSKEYMKRRAREIRLYNLLSNFAYQVNEGWEPDWESEYQNKWYIYQSHSSHGWSVSSYHRIQCMNMVYFKTEELARKAIEEIIIPFERGEL